ncbi:MAG TPA: NAD-dependent epimerase/dehydratase family protein [Bacteroidetes bacterium]|nr:NAD-dependent epimerase/dehydratase family protein [Bacteroidota bacterium]
MGEIKLKGKKILVTGGNGYLGSFLVGALKKELADVTVLDKEGLTTVGFFKVDITDEIAVKEAIDIIKPEIIFHLASSLDRNRDFMMYKKVNDINHLGTFNLLSALKDIHYDNFIFTSTSEVYGENKVPFHENQMPKPVSQYSLTKVYAENLIQTFSKTFNKNYTILRLFNFYGEDMPSNFFIPQMIDAFSNKKYFEMTKGEQKRDFLYIYDVIQALILSAKHPKAKNELFNVCSGKTATLRQLAEEVKSQMKSDCKIKYGAIPYRETEIWNMVGDNSKIKDTLNYEVKYDLAEGIKKLLK